MKKVTLYLTALLFAVSAQAQKAEVFSTNGKAIKGYDAVAFFTQSKAVKGNESFSYHWKDVDWLFANQEDLDSFKINPEKYAPQFGGYCAYGVADGHKAPTETDTWSVVNGKLYFNYNKNVKQAWTKNQPALIQKADTNWAEIQDKE